MQAASLRDKIRGMNMKIMTVLAVASLAIAGAACSESQTKASPESTDKVAVEPEAGGTLNLSLPSGLAESQPAGGTLNLNLGGASDEPRLIGSDQIGEVNFNGAPDPAFASETDDGEDDDIIRLDPK